MHFIHTDAPEGSQALLDDLCTRLRTEQRTLWLVPGGSNIPIVAAVMHRIPEGLTHSLTVLLTDERYGDVNHPDSNAYQLQQAGFDPKQGTFLPVLTGSSLAATVTAYEQTVKDQFAANEIFIGQSGIGADGHIAGILPNSPAAREEHALVYGYATDTYTRITLTFPALRRLSLAYSFVYGDTKHQTLEQLRDQTLPLITQPSQILKYIPQAYVYNDQVDTKKRSRG